MQPNDLTPTPLVEAFVLIEQPRQRHGHWSQVLAALDSPLAPPLALVQAYYDPTCDQALIELRYDALALGPARLKFVVEVAVLAEVGLIQPAELSTYERTRFLNERLARCTVQVPHQRSVIGALDALVATLRKQRAGKPPPVPMATRTAVPLLARGTRDDLPRSVREDLATKVVLPRPELPRPDVPHRHVIGRTSRLPTVETPRKLATRLRSETRVVDVDDDDLPAPSDAYVPAGPDTPSVIHARYLRGGRWVPVRVGALSLKGAALLTGALPRLHDRVEIALAFSGHRALVRGTVGKVSTVRESASTGASTFSLKFELDDLSRAQLTALLTAARAANVTIKPPPARQTRRFPVEWPAALTTPRGPIKANALDVSTAGMFVRPLSPLVLDWVVDYSVVLDDTMAPVVGRAKVVRQVTDADARRCGLAQGFGLQITAMGEADRMRWLGFLARIERRADKRVLIGAAPARLAELQALLAGSGYVVVGGTDPGALMQLASADTRPADAVLIDAGWLQNGASTSWVESLFSARNVPCVTVQGDSRRARQTIDKLLEVVV